jgi:hypothetical protein
MADHISSLVFGLMNSGEVHQYSLPIPLFDEPLAL